MPRHIDAEAFYKHEAGRCGSEPIVGTCTLDNAFLKYELNSFPTADVQEVRHGRLCGDAFDAVYQVKRCDNCDEYTPIGYYCYNCGAKMDLQ